MKYLVPYKICAVYKYAGLINAIRDDPHIWMTARLSSHVQAGHSRLQQNRHLEGESHSGYWLTSFIFSSDGTSTNAGLQSAHHIQFCLWLAGFVQSHLSNSRQHHPGSDQQCRQTNLTVAGNPGTTLDMAALPAPTSISFRLSLAAALQEHSVLRSLACCTRPCASCMLRMTNCRLSAFILQTRQ